MSIESTMGIRTYLSENRLALFVDLGDEIDILNKRDNIFHRFAKFSLGQT